MESLFHTALVWSLIFVEAWKLVCQVTARLHPLSFFLKCIKKKWQCWKRTHLTQSWLWRLHDDQGPLFIFKFCYEGCFQLLVCWLCLNYPDGYEKSICFCSKDAFILALFFILKTHLMGIFHHVWARSHGMDTDRCNFLIKLRLLRRLWQWVLLK